MGKNNKVYIDNILKNELQKYATEVAIGLATKVRDELTEITSYAIDEFYKSYTPVSYNRNYYNFKKNSFTKFYQNSHNSIIRGGVELTPDNLDSIYSTDKYIVFNTVYSGIHGFPSVTPTMNPNPYKIITDYRNDIISNIQDYKMYGIQRANKNNYTMLKS